MLRAAVLRDRRRCMSHHAYAWSSGNVGVSTYLHSTCHAPQALGAIAFNFTVLAVCAASLVT